MSGSNAGSAEEICLRVLPTSYRVRRRDMIDIHKFFAGQEIEFRSCLSVTIRSYTKVLSSQLSLFWAASTWASLQNVHFSVVNEPLLLLPYLHRWDEMNQCTYVLGSCSHTWIKRRVFRLCASGSQIRRRILPQIETIGMKCCWMLLVAFLVFLLLRAALRKTIEPVTAKAHHICFSFMKAWR